mmetsp:Transcript_32333/g.48779  ORF Transcript_32333/g.48779 Transcript_32333/m.48779 type:complete len:218 (-) Transcript_32333:206-859(-)
MCYSLARGQLEGGKEALQVLFPRSLRGRLETHPQPPRNNYAPPAARLQVLHLQERSTNRLHSISGDFRRDQQSILAIPNHDINFVGSVRNRDKETAGYAEFRQLCSDFPRIVWERATESTAVQDIGSQPSFHTAPSELGVQPGELQLLRQPQLEDTNLVLLPRRPSANLPEEVEQQPAMGGDGPCQAHRIDHIYGTLLSNLVHPIVQIVHRWPQQVV